MAKNYLNRYVWLIDTIKRHGHITLSEISRQWQDSSLNDTGEGLPERTFFNHRDAIADTFGIEIKSDRSLGYYIANTDDLDGDSIKQWMLESMSLNNMLNESKDMRDRILFERIPSSYQWLSVLVNARREGKVIEMTYQSFNRDKPNTFFAHPYCLKLFRQRWYLLARSEEYDRPRVYALDRIHYISQSEKKATVPNGFSAEEFFNNYFGIIVGSDDKPSMVQIKVDNDQVKYLKSLPLHHSQSIIEETNEYTTFQYRLVPTFDFEQEILSRGEAVEVISPEWFRDQIKDRIRAMMSKYPENK